MNGVQIFGRYGLNLLIHEVVEAADVAINRSTSNLIVSFAWP